MPKQTFFNLPEEKRQIIEQAALDEFAEHGFDASNMNRIVEHSKIAKGSFYQYFNDKKDLYFHLINTLFQKKLQVIEPVMKSYKEHSFSHNLAGMFLLGLEWSQSEPKLHRLGVDFSTMQRPFMLEFMETHKPDTTNFLTRLLAHAQESGELRDDINISIASAFISSLVNEATIKLMGDWEIEAGQNELVTELLAFVGRAVLKNNAG